MSSSFKMTTPGHQFLLRAFALPDAASAGELYNEWAASYDNDLGAQSYASPQRTVAAAIQSFVAQHGSNQPLSSLRVLDAGCGTGLVGVCLAAAADPSSPQSSVLANFTVDGLDISPAMLEVARGKNVYRRLDVADLTQPLDRDDGSYNLVMCVGTLTKGHVGPSLLSELVRVTAEGGVVAATVHGEVWESGGYRDAVERLAGEGGSAEVLSKDEFGITEAATTGGRMLLLRKVAAPKVL